MGKYVLQIPADDDCVYLYDVEAQTLRKLCDITTANSIPDIVKKTLEKANLPVKTKEGNNA